MKNPHGVEPTRYMKRKESKWAIGCYSEYGPVFSTCALNRDDDIIIVDKCNEEDSCFIKNDGNSGYECHQDHKSSLFVNTAGPNERNYFSVLDYEVYTQY